MLNAEIVENYADPAPASKLLYAPVSDAVRCVETRRYALDVSGDEKAALEFVDHVLADKYSQTVHLNAEPAVSDYNFYLDIGMKANTLDLEKEYVLKYYRGHDELGFELKDLTIFRRVYILGENSVPADTFVKDLVNPVIHTWEVNHA